MKRLLFLALLCINQCFGQEQLSFKTPYYNAIDRWVAFNKKGENDTTYMLGFLYFDQQAGFTFDYESSFILTDTGLYKLPKIPETSFKLRLAEKTAPVAILSEEQLKQLGLPAQPEWLNNYKQNKDKVPYLLNLGYSYNHVGASQNAIEPLQKAFVQDPSYKGLAFELSYAYNATEQFEAAVALLTKAIVQEPENAWLYRELGYAYKNSGKLELSDQSYRKGISLAKEDAEKAEMAINMAQAYYIARDKAKFEEWTKLTKKYAPKDTPFKKIVDSWSKNWDKQ